jgi:hypothetical protein
LKQTFEGEDSTRDGGGLCTDMGASVNKGGGGGVGGGRGGKAVGEDLTRNGGVVTCGVSPARVYASSHHPRMYSSKRPYFCFSTSMYPAWEYVEP